MRRGFRDTLTDNLSYKIVSLFIALILWLTILGRRDFSLTKTIDIELMTGPNKVVVSQSVEMAKVKVSGPRTALKKFMDSGLSQLLIIDISDKGEGEFDVEIPLSQIDVPFGVKVISVKPPLVRAKVIPKN
jgi:YbbR domain-containing protein